MKDLIVCVVIGSVQEAADEEGTDAPEEALTGVSSDSMTFCWMTQSMY